MFDPLNFMGLNYSAGSASTAFLHAIELTGPAIIKEGFLSRHSISHYTRYADNLFFVVKRVAVSGLLEALKNIRPYTGKVESVGEGCPILDLNLYRGPRFKCSSCLDFEPIMRIKGPPLSPDSNHPSSLPGPALMFIGYGCVCLASEFFTRLGTNF